MIKQTNLKGIQMKSIFVLLALILTTTANAGIQAYNTAGTELGIYSRVKCGTGMTCTQVSGRLNIASTSYGTLKTQVAATATTITAAQCGSVFINSGSVAINLPEASAVLGCQLTFITGNASNFDVNPDDADQILIETNAAGDSMRNATLGNSITI